MFKNNPVLTAIMQLIIITDMDGCFLDHDTYNYEDSVEAFNKAVKQGAIISFCTSKNLDEIEAYNKKLGVNFPFIAENGSVIYIPKDFFGFEFEFQKETEDYKIIELNVKHDETIKMLHKIRKELSFEFIIFSEMTPEEINEDCGLSIEAAKLAKNKQYADVVKIVDETPEKVEQFRQAVEKENFSSARGIRYHTITKGSNKGKAAKVLLDLYKRKYNKIVSIGLGDSPNDVSMLKEVDSPYLVAKPDGSHTDTGNLTVEKVGGIGPKGWSKAVNELLDNSQ
jgi:mannosyl-3-phosphoglycerate phosphatase|tara:strand:+ start:3484 stop:4329 length:846 start_codon:yes stop_codon:yes gene_type:complete